MIWEKQLGISCSGLKSVLNFKTSFKLFWGFKAHFYRKFDKILKKNIVVESLFFLGGGIFGFYEISFCWLSPCQALKNYKTDTQRLDSFIKLYSYLHLIHSVHSPKCWLSIKIFQVYHPKNLKRKKQEKHFIRKKLNFNFKIFAAEMRNSLTWIIYTVMMTRGMSIFFHHPCSSPTVEKNSEAEKNYDSRCW